MPRKRILAIDPGTRYIGYALLERGKPVYYGVKVIKGGNNLPHQRLREAKSIVLDLIQDFGPGSWPSKGLSFPTTVTSPF